MYSVEALDIRTTERDRKRVSGVARCVKKDQT